MPSFDSNIRFVYFCAKGVRARVYFLATYFLYFIARISRAPFLFFVNITKRKNVQPRESISLYTGLSVVEIAKKLEKSKCWVEE